IPDIFSFPPCTAHFLFDVSKRKWGVHSNGQSPLRNNFFMETKERKRRGGRSARPVWRFEMERRFT
ncbi:hypothetical protein, partial [uncultured Dysosmobacter sp.]|uniref:hypothetical protein n=1 Tax=uncultured Dysosmobacter sp. TaxID=2591384 RepID=UPI002672E577